VDRTAMSIAIYPVLRRLTDESAVRNVVATSAEGYAFPTNLDRDQPVDGLAPKTEADLVQRALGEKWDDHQLAEALDAHRQRRLPPA
ncbi:MAG TPA: hypothetical protein VGJ63_17885, partial [Micromonosporaceae bacterium]